MNKASLIIPLYNSQDYIGSILAFLIQFNNKYNTEIIVVNDGSTDRSREEALKFKDHIKFIDLEENHGRSFARNRGVDVANGNVIIFLDADCLPNDECFFSLHILFHENHEGSLNGLVLTNTDISDDLYVRYRFSSYQPKHPILKTITPDGFATGNVSIKKKNLISAGGFDETLLFLEDVDLGLRLQSKKFTYFTDENIVVYHLDKDVSLSRNMKRNYIAYSDSIKKIISKDRKYKQNLPMVRLFEKKKNSILFHFKYKHLFYYLYHFLKIFEKHLPENITCRLFSFLGISAAFNGYYGYNEKRFQNLEE